MLFFQIDPLKSLGSNGFPVRFLQRSQRIMKDEVTKAVKQFFSDGCSSDDINDTIVSLIPKPPDADELKNRQTYSFMDVLYKTIQ